MYDHSDLHEESATRCYYALKHDVIPAFNVSYHARMGFMKVPMGRVRLKTLEADDRVLLLKMKMQIVAYSLVPITMGSVLRVYCHEAGNKLTNVEFSAESLKVTDSRVMNAYLQVAYKLPGMKSLAKKVTPRYYFEETLVYDARLYDEKDFLTYWNQLSLKYIFDSLHRKLKHQLRKKIE